MKPLGRQCSGGILPPNRAKRDQALKGRQCNGGILPPNRAKRDTALKGRECNGGILPPNRVKRDTALKGRPNVAQGNALGNSIKGKSPVRAFQGVILNRPFRAESRVARFGGRMPPLHCTPSEHLFSSLSKFRENTV